MNKLFINNLKVARLASGLTQKQVAEKLSVVESCYANWEQGRAEPSVSAIQNLCVVLDITANELLGIEDNGNQIKIIQHS